MVSRAASLPVPPTAPPVPDFPSSVALDTIAHCNARCPFCPLYGPQAEMTRPKGWMPLDLSESVLRQVAERRGDVSVIYFCFHGEPLLDPHLELRFEQVRRHRLGPLVTMLTNGQFLDEARARTLLRADVREIMLGFDAATRRTYERHRVGCDYDRVLGNVRRFLELRQELQEDGRPRAARTRLSIQFVRTPHNAHEVADAYAMWGGILEPGHDRFYNTTSRNWGTERLDRGDWILETTRTAGKERLPCALLRTSLTVLHDGRIAVCNWDYNGDLVEDAGNARETPLAALWRGSGYERIRAAHARLDFTALPRCEGCVMTRPGYHEEAVLGFEAASPSGGSIGEPHRSGSGAVGQRTRFGLIHDWPAATGVRGGSDVLPILPPD